MPTITRPRATSLPTSPESQLHDQCRGRSAGQAKRHKRRAGGSAPPLHSSKRSVMPYAEVALAVQTPFPQAFTYRVPVGMVLCPGTVVIVPFGRQTLPGIVLRISEHSGYEGETRDVALAGETVLLPHQVALARWLADRYLASIHACVALMLPPDAGRRLREIVEWTGVADSPDLSAADARLLERLRASGRATPATLRRSFGGPTDAAIARLTAMGAVRRTVGLADPPSVAAVAPVMPVPPTALTAAQ